MARGTGLPRAQREALERGVPGASKRRGGTYEDWAILAGAGSRAIADYERSTLENEWRSLVVEIQLALSPQTTSASTPGYWRFRIRGENHQADAGLKRRKELGPPVPFE